MAGKALFDWADPLGLDDQLTDEGGAQAAVSREKLPARRRQLVMRGSVSPAPDKLTLQRKTRKGWRTVGYGKTDKHGRYALIVDRVGSYRVLAGGGVGPAVRIR